VHHKGALVHLKGADWLKLPRFCAAPDGSANDSKNSDKISAALQNKSWQRECWLTLLCCDQIQHLWQEDCLPFKPANSHW
jgi:hypothetical protein